MWGAPKSQGYEEEQNFPPPAHHCWCPLATKGLQFAAEWCRARASAWSSWKSQQAQLQLTCQKLPLPTKVYLTNSSGVTDHLVPVVTTKSAGLLSTLCICICISIYIYIPLSLSTPICNQSPSIPPCQQKINPQIQPSRTIPNQAFQEDQQPLVRSHQLQSNHPSFGKAQPEIPYWPCVPGVSTERESWWKNRDLCWGPKCQVEGIFMDLCWRNNGRKSWWSSLSTHWLHVDLSGLVQNHLEMLFWSWRLNLVKSRQASSLQHRFIFPGSCQAQNVFKNNPSTSCILVQHL